MRDISDLVTGNTYCKSFVALVYMYYGIVPVKWCACIDIPIGLACSLKKYKPRYSAVYSVMQTLLQI